MKTKHTTTTTDSDQEPSNSAAGKSNRKSSPLLSDNPDDEPWLGTSASAKHVGASIPTFRRWLKLGFVTAKRTPTGELRFRRSELNKLIS